MQNLPANIEQLTPEIYCQLLEERNELIGDLKTAKNNILKIVDMLGLIDKEGKLKEKPNVSKILSVVGSVATGKNKDQFAFMKEFLPLVEKYKDL